MAIKFLEKRNERKKWQSRRMKVYIYIYIYILEKKSRLKFVL